MARKIRGLGEISPDNIRTAAGKTIAYCVKHFKTKQYVSTCSVIANKMLKILLNRAPDITHRDVAAAANIADRKCASYGRQDYGKVCFKVVGGFIRMLSKSNPGLEGRRRR